MHELCLSITAEQGSQGFFRLFTPKTDMYYGIQTMKQHCSLNNLGTCERGNVHTEYNPLVRCNVSHSSLQGHTHIDRISMQRLCSGRKSHHPGSIPAGATLQFRIDTLWLGRGQVIYSCRFADFFLSFFGLLLVGGTVDTPPSTTHARFWSFTWLNSPLYRVWWGWMRRWGLRVVRFAGLVWWFA